MMGRAGFGETTTMGRALGGRLHRAGKRERHGHADAPIRAATIHREFRHRAPIFLLRIRTCSSHPRRSPPAKKTSSFPGNSTTSLSNPSPLGLGTTPPSSSSSPPRSTAFPILGGQRRRPF
ncbi:hypothetical protein ABZP36_017976 [Zizania latifolia]